MKDYSEGIADDRRIDRIHEAYAELLAAAKRVEAVFPDGELQGNSILGALRVAIKNAEKVLS